MRCWFSGRMPAFQAGDKSSILLRRTKNKRSEFCGRKIFMPKHKYVRIEKKTGILNYN